MALFTHEFEAPLSTHGVGKSRVIWYQVLFLPGLLAKTLPLAAYPRLRTGDGRHYFIVSQAVRKGTNARLGDVLDMRFVVDDQDRVDVPPALAHALSARPELQVVWEGLTPGKRRGLAHLVAQAKSNATVQRRIQDVMDALVDLSPLG